MYLLGSGMAQRRVIIRKHMEVLKFINSKDIREYLKKIDYKFNSLEAAWLIYQCRNATICEKHRAWNELIESMPDCRIEERFNTAPQESLHTFLKQYMELEDRYIKEFCDEKHTSKFNDNKPFAYQCSYIYQNGPEYDWNTVFSCLDTLYEATMEPEEDVIAVKCTKMQVDRLDSRQIAYLTPSFEFMCLDPGHIESGKENEIYNGVFEGLWFDFPTPFRKGDVVWEPNKPKGLCAGPFVTTGICLEGIASEKVKDHIRKNGDMTDMCARGYFMNEDGSFYKECMCNYMDLEFYLPYYV